MSLFEDTIGYSRDKDGKDEPFTLGDVYNTLVQMTKICYFNFMINCVDADYEGFSKMHMETTEKIVKVVHDTYADHVEGARQSVLDKEEKDNG